MVQAILATHGRNPVTDRGTARSAEAREVISTFLTAGEETLAGFLVGSLRRRDRDHREQLGDKLPNPLADLGFRMSGDEGISPVDRVDDQFGVVGDLSG